MDKVIESGHTACLGCGEILGVRMLLEELGKNTIVGAGAAEGAVDASCPYRTARHRADEEWVG